MKRNILTALIILLLAPSMSASKPAPLPDQCKAFTHKTMPYRLLIPKDYGPSKKYPLILCFHGAGGRGTDNQAKGTTAGSILISDATQQKQPCFVLMPQCPDGKQWVDTPWDKGSYSLDKVKISDQMALALEILDNVMKEYSIDPDRVYVSGQSMGGFATWDAIMRRPNFFAAAIVNCGSGDPTKAELIKHIPIWNFHGDKDSIVPVRGSREMVEALKKVGGNIQYTEQPGAGHVSWSNAWATPGVTEWLFAQKRGQASTSAPAQTPQPATAPASQPAHKTTR